MVVQNRDSTNGSRQDTQSTNWSKNYDDANLEYGGAKPGIHQEKVYNFSNKCEREGLGRANKSLNNDVSGIMNDTSRT